MNENYRHRQLLNLLDERKILSTNEIISLLGISPATARRDINKLSEQGRLRKVRNGAETLKSNNSLNPNHITINNASEKQRIALAATKLCSPDDSIVITCGSTMLILGMQLCGEPVQIITNFLPLANYLIENDHNNVVITGGQYNKNQAIMVSMNSNKNDYTANIMFTSGRGITTEGLYKTDVLVANSEQSMRHNVDKLVVLLDSTKLGKRAGMLFSELNNIDILITGQEADAVIISQLREKGLEVILA